MLFVNLEELLGLMKLLNITIAGPLKNPIIKTSIYKEPHPIGMLVYVYSQILLD